MNITLPRFTTKMTAAGNKFIAEGLIFATTRLTGESQDGNKRGSSLTVEIVSMDTSRADGIRKPRRLCD